jgi:1-phosphatidylinositol phosphodiesterase
MLRSGLEVSRSARIGLLLVVGSVAAAACRGTPSTNDAGAAGLDASPADGGAGPHDASNDAFSDTDAAPADASVAAPQDAGADAPNDAASIESSTADAGQADSGSADAGAFTAASWMGAIAGGTSLADLSIPGTHDTGATVEISPGTTKCQDLSVADQLAIGVRYFDIRCVNDANQFDIYHTTVFQNLTFDQVLESVYAFFDANPGETLVMSVKEEEPASGSTNTFEQTFDSYTAQQPTRWYLGATTPTLDQVRGKIVLLRRFGATAAPKGIDATAWADNTTFTIANGSATLRIQDYYQVTDDPSKWAAIQSLFAEARQGDAGVLYLNNTSAYEELDSGLENIPVVSDVIGPEVASYFTTNTSGRFGIVGMDFVDATKSSLILRTNFE